MKGHVPAKHLNRYRWLTRTRWQASSVQGVLVSLGEIELAGHMREAATVLRAKANDLRVDLPERRQSDGLEAESLAAPEIRGS